MIDKIIQTKNHSYEMPEKKDNIKKLEDTGAEIAYCGRAVFSDKVEDNLKK